VVVPRGIQNVLDLVVVALSPLLVHRTTIVSDSPEDGEQRKRNNGLLVDDVDLVADGRNGETCTGGQDGRLGGNAATRERVNNGLSLRLGVVLRHVGLEAGGDEGSVGGGYGAGGQSRSDTGGAC